MALVARSITKRPDLMNMSRKSVNKPDGPLGKICELVAMMRRRSQHIKTDQAEEEARLSKYYRGILEERRPGLSYWKDTET